MRPPGAPGLGMAPGGGGPTTENDFKTATKGAESFLSALKDKDPERLAEATALHAKYEIEVPNKEHLAFFTAVLEKTATPSDIEALAKEFAGMKVMGTNTRKSTGMTGVIVGKTEDNKRLTRTLYVRHEEAGWKVQDFSGLKRLTLPRTARTAKKR